MYPNGEVAFRRFAQLLRQNKFMIINRLPKNRNRHTLITTLEIDFYCLYRDSNAQYGTFEKFNDFFEKFVNENPEFRGHAESINKEILLSICDDYTNKKDVVLVFIYKDGKKYIANPFLFKKFAEKYDLIRTHNASDLRRISNGNYGQIFETTYHLPFKKIFFKNFDKWVMRYEQNNKKKDN